MQYHSFQELKKNYLTEIDGFSTPMNINPEAQTK